MKKGNATLFFLIFIPQFTGLLVWALSINLPLHAQTQSSTATPSLSATSSPTKSWIEENGSLIGFATTIIGGIIGILTAINLVERKNQTIQELTIQNKNLEKDNDFVSGLITNLVKQSEDMKHVVDRLGEHHAIATSIIYQELRLKINDYYDDVKTLPKTIDAHREAKRLLARKQVKNLLFKSAFNKSLESFIKEYGRATELEKRAIKKDICNCLNIIYVSLNEGIVVRRTNIKKSEIILTTQAIQPCLVALNHIKSKDIQEYLSRGEVSIDAVKDIEKYLDSLISMLSQ